MIVLATGIEAFNQELKSKIENQNIGQVKAICYREFLMDEKFFSDTVIISKRLQGDTSIKELLFSLKKRGMRIIYITDKEDVDGILYCFDLAVYDFLFDPVSSDDVVNCISNPNSFTDVSSVYLNFKHKGSEKKDDLGFDVPDINDTAQQKQKERIREVEKIKVVEKKIIETRFYKQNVITFYGANNNILSSQILVNSAVRFCKKTGRKILIIDADAVPCMDHLLDVPKEISVKDSYNMAAIDTGLSACYSSIENGTFSPSLLQKFILSCKNKNIDVLTGIYQDRLIDNMDMVHYQKIIEAAKKLYDVILIAVNPFKSNVGTIASVMSSDKIVAVVESNYLSARNTFSSIKTFERIGVSRDKFGIVIFDWPGALDFGTMEKIFDGYNIVAELPFNKSYNRVVNNKKPLTLMPKADREAYDSITKFMGLSGSILIQHNEKPQESQEDLMNKEPGDTENSHKGYKSLLNRLIGRK